MLKQISENIQKNEKEYNGVCFLRNTTICFDCCAKITDDITRLPLLSNLHHQNCICLNCKNCKKIRLLINEKIETKLDYFIESLLVGDEISIHNIFVYFEKRDIQNLCLMFLRKNKLFEKNIGSEIKKMNEKEITEEYYNHRMLYELLLEQKDIIMEKFFNSKIVLVPELEDFYELLFEALFINNDMKFIQSERAERFFIKYCEFREGFETDFTIKSFLSKVLHRYYNLNN